MAPSKEIAPSKSCRLFLFLLYFSFAPHSYITRIHLQIFGSTLLGLSANIPEPTIMDTRHFSPVSRPPSAGQPSNLRTDLGPENGESIYLAFVINGIRRTLPGIPFENVIRLFSQYVPQDNAHPYTWAAVFHWMRCGATPTPPGIEVVYEEVDMSGYLLWACSQMYPGEYQRSLKERRRGLPNGSVQFYRNPPDYPEYRPDNFEESPSGEIRVGVERKNKHAQWSGLREMLETFWCNVCTGRITPV